MSSAPVKSYTAFFKVVSADVGHSMCKFLTSERAKQFRKGVAKDGDVLFAHNATVGPVALLRTTEPFVILSTTATYFRCDLDKLNNGLPRLPDIELAIYEKPRPDKAAAALTAAMLALVRGPSRPTI